MVKWSEQYLVGIEELDKQHQSLFEFFEVLETKIRARESGIINDAVKFMESYMLAHFKYEEGCMIGSKCPESEKNIQAHRLFITKLKDFDEQLKSSSDPFSLLLEMNQFVELWLVGHIYKVDTELKKCWNNSLKNEAVYTSDHQSH